jgi:RNAse (barnase) inhibitor barstar
MKITYEIDGERATTLKEFYDEISRVLVPDYEWGHNLDAFNDLLHGGFGTPEEGFVLAWKNSEVSREKLGDDFNTLVDIIESHDDLELVLS